MRFLIVILLTILLAGCTLFSGAPKTGGPQYTGEPTDLVVRIQRSAASPQGMSLLATASDETHQVIVRIQKGNIYRAFEVVDIPASETEAVIQIELPSATGYVVSAISRDDLGAVIEEGHEADIAVAANAGNVVVLELGPPEYEVTIPDVLYSGGEVRQFKLSVPTASMLQNKYVRLALQPWSDSDEWLNIPHNQRWVSVNPDRFPQVTEPTPVYYQIHLCASDLPEGILGACYREPAMGEPLPFVMIYPGPPPS